MNLLKKLWFVYRVPLMGPSGQTIRFGGFVTKSPRQFIGHGELEGAYLNKKEAWKVAEKIEGKK